MNLDVEMLSRIQFALTIMFHYIFPPLTIGMGVVLVYLGFQYLRTGEPMFRVAQKFWTKLFALNFAIGVASGIVMEFQFGTNWSNYSRFVGDVFGSALAAEGIFAFFLESGFLAVLVFGWDKVGPRMHFFSTLMVSLGSIFSSVWIVVANSWQQTPAGSSVVQQTTYDPETGQTVLRFLENGMPVMRAEIFDFWQVVFNPSTMHRLVHVWLGAFVVGAFFILSISAWYVLKKKHVEFARYSFRGALVLALLSSIGVAVHGHFQAQSVYKTQPAKLAAFEGHFETGVGDLTLFGIPDAENETVHGRVAVPGGLSFLVHDNFNNETVLGLDIFRPEDRPPMTIPFWSWRLMIGLGVFFIALSALGCFFMWRGTLFDKRWMMWLFVVSVVGALAANQLGWIAAEVGRQPWVVYPAMVVDDAGDPVLDDQGYVQWETVTALNEAGEPVTRVAGLRTSEGISQVVSATEVLISLIMFGLIYLLLGAVWLFVLNGKIQHGPEGLTDADGKPIAHAPQGFFKTASTRYEDHMVKDK